MLLRRSPIQTGHAGSIPVTRSTIFVVMIDEYPTHS